MRTLILYATRRGFTAKCAGLLRDALHGGGEIRDLAGSPAPVLDGYDQVVLGGPVYGSSSLKGFREFQWRHLDALLKKKLGLFVVSLSPRETAWEYLEKLFLPPLLSHAHARAAFGGGITWRSLAWWEKLVLRVRGIRRDVSNLNMQEIQRLAQEMEGPG